MDRLKVFILILFFAEMRDKKPVTICEFCLLRDPPCFRVGNLKLGDFADCGFEHNIPEELNGNYRLDRGMTANLYDFVCTYPRSFDSIGEFRATNGLNKED